jgi:mycothiol maleylpyruvate isomerase-like protein
MTFTNQTRSYEETIDALDEGLRAVDDMLSQLSGDDWERPTRLQPPDPESPPWNVLTLALHYDVFLGMTGALVGGAQDAPPARDRASFCISVADRSLVAPVVYQYMLDYSQGHTPATVLDTVRQTAKNTLEVARTNSPDTVGPGWAGALIRLDEFVATRVSETLIHGLDLTDALGRPPLSMPKSTPIVAELLEDIVARMAVPGRPADLVGDDLGFIRAAAGRGEHPDPRFPVVG